MHRNKTPSNEDGFTEVNEGNEGAALRLPSFPSLPCVKLFFESSSLFLRRSALPRISNSTIGRAGVFVRTEVHCCKSVNDSTTRGASCQLRRADRTLIVRVCGRF